MDGAHQISAIPPETVPAKVNMLLASTSWVISVTRKVLTASHESVKNIRGIDKIGNIFPVLVSTNFKITNIKDVAITL